MISKIGKKIIFTNIIILVVSLVVFCIAVTISMNDYVLENTKEQLLAENEIAHSMALLGDETRSQRFFSNLTDSTTLTYTIVRDRTGYELELNTDTEFANSNELEDIVKSLIDNDDSEVKEYDIDGERYLVTQKTNRKKAIRTDAVSISIVSIIPLESVKEISYNNIAILIVFTAIMIILSSIIFLLVSKRITNPIKTLSIVTDEYSNRNFKNSLHIKTGDEVESLSNSVSKMAESLIEYEKDKTKTYRNISHEIKTPLTAIYGYAEGIKNHIFDNQDEKLDIIMEESLRIKGMVEDIILLSKLESNTEIFSLEKHSINEVIIAAIEKIESVAIMKNIDIFYTPTEDAAIKIDKDKVLRAIINVLSNAIKYTKDMIDVKTRISNGKISLCISDNGDGFDSETLDRLFSDSTKERTEGSGIGLTIVNEIMKYHNGSINVTNKIGDGAIVELIFRI